MLTTLPEGTAFPSELFATIETYEFDSIGEDAHRLFNLFNNPFSVRTNEDMMGLYRAQFPELDTLSRKFLVRIANGIAEYQAAWRPTSRDLGCPGIAAHISTRRRIASSRSGPSAFEDALNNQFLGRPAIVAEMVSLWTRDAVKATEFWSYVMSENHPDPDHFTRELVRTFKDWENKPVHTAEQYRKRIQKTWKYFLAELSAAA